MAADSIAVLDKLNIKRAHILGISMGAMIAQVVAYLYPQRVASLISVMSASGNPRTGLGKLGAIRGLLSKPSDNSAHAMQAYLRKYSKLLARLGRAIPMNKLRK